MRQFHQALSLAQHGDRREAMNLVLRLLEQRPDFAPAIKLKGMLLEEAGRTSEAAAAYEEARAERRRSLAESRHLQTDCGPKGRSHQAAATLHPDSSRRTENILFTDRMGITIRPCRSRGPTYCQITADSLGIPCEALAATHLHVAGGGKGRTEGLMRLGSAVQRRDPTSNGTEYDKNYAHDKHGYED